MVFSTPSSACLLAPLSPASKTGLYNAGPARVARLGRIPDIAETRAYVSSVIACYLALTAGRGARNAPQCRTPERVR